MPCMPVHEGRFRGTSVSVCMRLHQPQGPHSILVKPACSIRKSTCVGQHPEEQSATVQACLIVSAVCTRCVKPPSSSEHPEGQIAPAHSRLLIPLPCCPPSRSGEHPEEQIAVLFRTHIQARLVEQELVRSWELGLFRWRS